MSVRFTTGCVLTKNLSVGGSVQKASKWVQKLSSEYQSYAPTWISASSPLRG